LGKRRVSRRRERLERGGDRGVTLIELMMVCSIIMLVLALMLPALDRARTEAQKVSCRMALRNYAMRYSESGKLVIEIPQTGNCHECHKPRYNARLYLDTIDPRP